MHAFPDLDRYFSALQHVQDPLHGIALNVTYGYGVQNFMVPVVEYYLKDWEQPDAERPEWWLHKGVELRFICTPTLSADFAEVADDWGLPVHMQIHVHASKRNSDNETLGRALVNGDNWKWFQSLYANDISLYHKHCEGSRTRQRNRSRT